ncbi:MAG: bifunctional methylenetetrahydrofolate dehydrogenase/methenyltetrahydrofolate cyclohydrolase FolD [Deltaproteobacteria bacterium]|nr:bifunctional methylenetetrahydrofolate dehydrogenase/methenyltetrahydrofolate cyclohydrolase FolD [Deltaproteobacteria bacterium]
MATLIDGKILAQKFHEQIKEQVLALKAKHGIEPGLAVILVGDHPASQVYARNKIAACEKAGIKSFHHRFPLETPEEELLTLLQSLNQDPTVHGILVQLPLPAHLNTEKILDAIDPRKDVDGLHPVNLGFLIAGRQGPAPCTPLGVMKMLESIAYDLTGKQAVIVGRSNIVGKPMGLLLLAKNATVTFCHSKTKDLPVVIGQADVVVAAIGKPKFILGDWIKKGAVVIDVGINRVESNKLVGDVDFESCKKRASFITPVPGGVGPMTIAMLLHNTLQAAMSLRGT